MILQQRVFAIEACVFRLSIQHSEEIVTELRKWITVKEKFDTSNPEQYQRDLQAIINRCKSRYEIDLRQRLTELEQRLPQTEQKIDKWYFEKMIVQLQKTFGQINKFKTTVANFVFMMADLLARGEEMDRQLSKA
jgi:leucyl-tRNA synthetase